MSLIESFGWNFFGEKIILSITANTQLAAIFKTAPKALISAFRCVWSEKDLHSAGRGASRSRTAYPCKKEASTVENFRALASGKARQGKDWWKAARGNQSHRVAWPSGLRRWIKAPSWGTIVRLRWGRRERRKKKRRGRREKRNEEKRGWNLTFKDSSSLLCAQWYNFRFHCAFILHCFLLQVLTEMGVRIQLKTTFCSIVK